ncbi:MAG: DUF4337 domain-containing protein [Alphaproteobacteria bacterium]|nr:DUF4337 domain-containing protein [Alphaproteobacteria bacterium]
MDIEVPLPDEKEKPSRLNTWVAITVALLATFTGICKVKDDNIVQAMQQAQADKIDHWAWYQSLHTREDMMENELARLKLMMVTTAADKQAPLSELIERTEEKKEKIIAHKEEMKKNAEDDQKNYDALNYHDDQFDLSDAMIAIAIALLAIAALSQATWLFCLALVPSIFGVIMGLSGLIGWQIHPDFIIKLLS